MKSVANGPWISHFNKERLKSFHAIWLPPSTLKNVFLWHIVQVVCQKERFCQKCFFFTERLRTKKGHNLLSYFLFIKKFRKYLIFLTAFYLILWLMKLPKFFEKIAILKIGELVSFWGVKTYFGILPLKWYTLRHGKNWFSQIFFWTMTYKRKQLLLPRINIS